MLRIALRVREDDLETVLDQLLPILPAGVHQADVEPGVIELATFGMEGHIPDARTLAAAAGDALVGEPEEMEVPVDWRERRKLFGRGYVVGDRMYLRSPHDPPGPEDLIDLVIERQDGAFGTGAHPTTRGALELMLGLEPGGSFADLGCGTGTLAIAAAKLGWSPVIAVDYTAESVEATRANAERNGVQIEVHQVDLLDDEAPPARVVAANVPPVVHRAIAAELPSEVEQLVLSGVVAAESSPILEVYEQAGLEVTGDVEGEGWTTVLLERSHG